MLDHYCKLAIILAVLPTGCRRCGDREHQLPPELEDILETTISESETMVSGGGSLSDSSDYYSGVDEEVPGDSRDTSGILSEEELFESLEGVMEELNEAQQYIDNQGYISE